MPYQVGTHGMLSVLTTNVSASQKEIAFTISNLALQSYKNFEWIFIDAYHEENKDMVKKLCIENNIGAIHVPACMISHVGKMYRWELYNNALLLSSGNIFIRFGLFRYFHRDVFKKAMEYGSNNLYVNFPQGRVSEEIYDLNIQDVENKWGLNTNTSWMHVPESHCGMYSFLRSEMIAMNGNDETLWQHWEDCEINSRWQHPHFANIRFVDMNNALIRIEHANKILNKNNFKSVCWAKHCISSFNEYYIDNSTIPEQYDQFYYRGFKWIGCKECGAICPVNVNAYVSYLKTYKEFLAPIGVRGVLGRDIRILDEDLKKLTNLDDKVDLLMNSHTNPRYLKDTCG